MQKWLTQQVRVFPPGFCGLLSWFSPEWLGVSLQGLSPQDRPGVQQHPYHPAVVPEEDEARFGDHPRPVGAQDGQVLSLRLQARGAQGRVEKRQLLLGTRNRKVEMRGGPPWPTRRG